MTSNETQMISGAMQGQAFQSSVSSVAKVFAEIQDSHNVVQRHLRLPYVAPPEYLPELGTHQAQERRAVGTLGQLRWTTARKTPLEVWLPGNFARELWWFPGGLTGHQSGPDLKCAPESKNPRRNCVWRVLHCGSA